MELSNAHNPPCTGGGGSIQGGGVVGWLVDTFWIGRTKQSITTYLLVGLLLLPTKCGWF